MKFMTKKKMSFMFYFIELLAINVPNVSQIRENLLEHRGRVAGIPVCSILVLGVWNLAKQFAFSVSVNTQTVEKMLYKIMKTVAFCDCGACYTFRTGNSHIYARPFKFKVSFN